MTQAVKSVHAWEILLKNFKIRREERKEGGNHFTLKSHLPNLYIFLLILLLILLQFFDYCISELWLSISSWERLCARGNFFTVLTETLANFCSRVESLPGTHHAGGCTGTSFTEREPWNSRNCCMETQKVHRQEHQSLCAELY